MHTARILGTTRCALSLTTILALVACGGVADGNGAMAEAPANGEYVVERADADGIDTVRTVAGSRWGGDGRLVEELSIGEEIGDDPYLFGQISAAWATEDRIYVVDSQVPAIRAYDHQGNYLFDVGGVGQGPGEYGQPMSLAVDSEGRVIVTDLQTARLNIFDADGAPLEDWSLGSSQAAMGLEMTYDGELFTRMIEMPDMTQIRSAGGPVEIRMGMQSVGPDGPSGDPVFPPESDYEPPTTSVEVGGTRMQMAALPFTARQQWVFTPGGDIVVGVGNDYRFEIRRPDGRVTAIEKYWDPVPVDPDELDFRAEMASANLRRMAPDFTIPESDIPDSKPAFTRFRADRSRRVWVVRQGPSRIDPDCTETGGAGGGGGGTAIMLTQSVGGGGGGGGGGMDVRVGDASSFRGGDEDEYEGDCWANTWSFDLFDLASGEFLGTVPAPETGFTIPMFVEGDTVLATVTDGMGVTRLKKYRLIAG